MQGYLEGCRIFLSGFSALEQDTLKKIINNGGGMRLDVLSTRVTHIVTKVTILKEVHHNTLILHYKFQTAMLPAEITILLIDDLIMLDFPVFRILRNHNSSFTTN
mgnify:CR=1 FL=1